MKWSLLAPPAPNTDRSTTFGPNWYYIFNLFDSFWLFEPVRVDHVLTSRHFRAAEAVVRHIGAREKQNFSLYWVSFRITQQTYEFRSFSDFHQSIVRYFRRLYQLMTVEFWTGKQQSFRRSSSIEGSKSDSYLLPYDHYKKTFDYDVWASVSVFRSIGKIDQKFPRNPRKEPPYTITIYSDFQDDSIFTRLDPSRLQWK